MHSVASANSNVASTDHDSPASAAAAAAAAAAVTFSTSLFSSFSNVPRPGVPTAAVNATVASTIAAGNLFYPNNPNNPSKSKSALFIDTASPTVTTAATTAISVKPVTPAGYSRRLFADDLAPLHVPVPTIAASPAVHRHMVPVGLSPTSTVVAMPHGRAGSANDGDDDVMIDYPSLPSPVSPDAILIPSASTISLPPVTPTPLSPHTAWVASLSQHQANPYSSAFARSGNPLQMRVHASSSNGRLSSSAGSGDSGSSDRAETQQPCPSPSSPTLQLLAMETFHVSTPVAAVVSSSALPPTLHFTYGHSRAQSLDLPSCSSTSGSSTSSLSPSPFAAPSASRRSHSTVSMSTGTSPSPLPPALGSFPNTILRSSSSSPASASSAPQPSDIPLALLGKRRYVFPFVPLAVSSLRVPTVIDIHTPTCLRLFVCLSVCLFVCISI
jgi:hypothetical protein